MRSADLRSADLRSADLRSADLSSANLSSANLRSADLSSADLSSADLSSADLRSADLRYANLSSADLRYAVHSWAQVAFMGHGECGRMLTAVVFKEGEPVVFQCGCFSGSEQELKLYIKEGDKTLRPSRTIALKTAIMLLAIKPANQ